MCGQHLVAATNQDDELRDCVRDVQRQYGSRDERIKGCSATDVDEAVEDAEDGSQDGRVLRHFSRWVYLCEDRRIRQAVVTRECPQKARCCKHESDGRTKVDEKDPEGKEEGDV